MHKRARKHKTITEYEIKEKLNKREYWSTFSHGPNVVKHRMLKRSCLYALQQLSIYGRRPWESQWRE